MDRIKRGDTIDEIYSKFGQIYDGINNAGKGEITFPVSTVDIDENGMYFQDFTVTTGDRLRPLFVLNKDNDAVEVDWKMITDGWRVISGLPLTGTVYFRVI